MKYTIATIAAFASVALAQPAFLNTDFSLTEGEPYTIRFSGCDSGCTIILQNGDSDDLDDYRTLTSSARGGSFTFTPSGMPSDDYNFKITDSAGEINYSAQFPYEGTGAAPSSTKESTTTAAETTTSSAPAVTDKSSTMSSMTKPIIPTTASEEHTTMHTPIATKNSTTPIATKNPTKTGSGSSEETGPATVPDSGAARMTSSLALIAGAVMAMVYLN
ncbi:hypothetical protein FZEAL_10173 [Fusarium zealandicum]|uniref:Yeast cell wall synthesis Kre9/Knh1-like N-terminal domain-containing protein n=1 Tax=Fusarium zealandicum TaxID=1053134 RepID=A0A8H4U4U0_9HYPO|nr:hypothetical protein FZEAL_10173 [Fusarium zealandicum]